MQKRTVTQSKLKSCHKNQRRCKSDSDSAVIKLKDKQTQYCLDSNIDKEPLTTKNSGSQTTSRECQLENIDLSSPGLCSALQLANEIQTAITQNVHVHKKNFFLDQNRLKETLKQKATKKTNIPFTEQIFKNLVDIQINDEDVITGTSATSKNKFCSKSKDKVFELSDYYKPDFSLEYFAKVPDKKLEFEKIQYYNGFEIYEAMESLPNLI